MFANKGDDTLKLKMTFEFRTNLRVRHEPEDTDQAELIIRPNIEVCIVIVPITEGEEINSGRCIINVEEFDGDLENYIDPNVLKWVESVWSTYDVDGDDRLNKSEARRFCDKHLNESVPHSKFFEMWAMLDQDKSGDLSRSELARAITWFKNQSR
jgi:hypothetical protein